MVKVLVNGDNERALLEVQLKQTGFEYPGIKLFEALIVQGVVGRMTSTSDAVPE